MVVDKQELRRLERQIPGDVAASLARRAIKLNWSDEKYAARLNSVIVAKTAGKAMVEAEKKERKSYIQRLRDQLPIEIWGDISYDAHEEGWSDEKECSELQKAIDNQNKREKIGMVRALRNGTFDKEDWFLMDC